MTKEVGNHIVLTAKKTKKLGNHISVSLSNKEKSLLNETIDGVEFALSMVTAKKLSAALNAFLKANK